MPLPGNCQIVYNPNTGTDIRLSLPDTFYVMAGQACEIFYEDYHVGLESYAYSVTCDSGNQFVNRFSWTPDSDVDANFSWQLDIYDGRYNKIASAISVLSVNPIDTSAAVNILAWGNSLFAGKITLDVVDTVFSNTDSLVWQGTQATAASAAACEAYSGQGPTWFESNVSSPFVSGGDVDIQGYLTGEGYADPDYVIVMQGTATFAGSTTLGAEPTNALAALDSLIDGFLADCPAAEIGICYTTPPSYNNRFQDGSFRVSYCQKINLHYWNELIKARYGIGGTHANSRVTLIPMTLDRRNNFPTASVQVNAFNSTTENVQTDHVHPAAAGYKQIARHIAGWLCPR